MNRDFAYERVMHKLLDRQAVKYGGRTYLYYGDQEFSFEEVNDAANRVASGLQKLGITKGDKVAVVMDNSPEVIFLVFGLSKLGAIEVPINTAHKGEMMTYMLEHSDSRMLVMHNHYIDRLRPVLANIPKIQSVVVLEGANSNQALSGSDASAAMVVNQIGALGKQVLEWSGLIDNDGRCQPIDVIWSDPLLILYTSGTTGLSKGVVLAHNFLFSVVERFCDGTVDVGEEDCIYNFLPLFHVHAWHAGINLALFSGARVVLAEKFSASMFWNEIKRYNCTYAPSVGSVTPILFKAEPRPDDAENPLRVLLGAPTPKEIFEAFEQRFGVRLVEFYGSTEIGALSMNQLGNRKVGSCGRVHPDFMAKIVDDADVEVGVNTPGEILIRPLKPYAMMLEYYKMPEKTVEAWSDMWFHTGDNGYFDEDGYLFFADRKKDALRRRGENISSFELEKVINSHPAVLESAVFGVKSELGEEEVMTCMTLAPGQNLSPEDFIVFCEQQMAYFMVPRYVRFVDDLPKTPSLRVEKYKLRDEGITPDTWDREKSGFKLKRPANNVPNRNERRKLKTKENVRKAAIETFLEVGYLNTTVQDIMERADLGYGTFYQYYKSKQDVIVELANEAREIIKNDYVLPPGTETSLYKKTLSKLEMVFYTYAKHRDVLKIFLECHHADEELHRAWNQLMEVPFKAIKKDLTWSMNRGLCRQVDLNTAIIALHGMVQAAGVYIVQNNISEQEIDQMTKDLGVLFANAMFIKDECPPETLRKKSNR